MSDVKLLLVGVTGLVGRHTLNLALSDPRIGSVIAPTRRLLPDHPKLSNPLIDFDNLPTDASWWQDIDAVICTLGTTMKAAGSKEMFYRVDHDYPLAFAQIAQRHGTYLCFEFGGRRKRLIPLFLQQGQGRIRTRPGSFGISHFNAGTPWSHWWAALRIPFW